MSATNNHEDRGNGASNVQSAALNYYLGLVLLTLAVILILGTIAYAAVSLEEDVAVSRAGSLSVGDWLTENLVLVISVAFSYVFFAGGMRLIDRAHKPGTSTIPLEDHDLIYDQIKNSETIDDYVKLRSLHGLTGFFTKIGLTGLPLTTVVLTLVFAVLYLGFERPVDVGPTETPTTHFLDLSKLTLGAFIGSYVQKGQDFNFQWLQNLMDQAKREVEVASTSRRSGSDS